MLTASHDHSGRRIDGIRGRGVRYWRWLLTVNTGEWTPRTATARGGNRRTLVLVYVEGADCNSSAVPGRIGATDGLPWRRLL
jgi:hypothetical protein